MGNGRKRPLVSGWALDHFKVCVFQYATLRGPFRWQPTSWPRRDKQMSRPPVLLASGADQNSYSWQPDQWSRVVEIQSICFYLSLCIAHAETVQNTYRLDCWFNMNQKPLTATADITAQYANTWDVRYMIQVIRTMLINDDTCKVVMFYISSRHSEILAAPDPNPDPHWNPTMLKA